ncbi:MAG: hypothetical protein WCJ02_06360 [bacterium]
MKYNVSAFISLLGIISFISATAYSEEDEPTTLTVSLVEATPALRETVKTANTLQSLQKIIDGTEKQIGVAAANGTPFVVIGGRGDQALINNDDRNRSALVDPNSSGDFGKAKAAKYGIILTVTGYSDTFGAPTQNGRCTFQRSVSVSITFSIINLYTTEVIVTTSEEIEKHYKNDIFRESEIQTEQGKSDKILAEVTKEIANAVVATCSEAVFPVTVIDVNKGVVTLSRGGNYAKVGDMLMVYAPPRKIINKATKKEIMVKGAQVGTLTVTSVESALTQGMTTNQAIVVDCVVKKNNTPENKR